VRRVFVAQGPIVTSGQVYDWCFREARQRRSHRHRRRVWQLLLELADPVQRDPL
jgi:hypothetical protein